MVNKGRRGGGGGGGGGGGRIGTRMRREVDTKF
jgi:hypothetical protein